MDKFDIYYRALTDYRGYTRDNNECTRQRKAIYRADADYDVIEVVKTECEIEDDWVDAIEVGLEHIGKAIAEERQFILSNGEVVSIEKVKNVSRESVEHLAKHSNLVTKKPEEGKDLIPDQLYTVERLTDYAVYENRFLYMLLCYLRDFISIRYNAILELTTTYSGKMSMKKSVSTGNRQLNYEVTLTEKQRNDEFLRNNNSSKDKIDKIDGLLKAVLSYLSLPLMDEVSKAPMLKPPITETNVLKMNRNFKGAMKLYYFITAYTKRGYSYTSTTQRINPFKENIADEIAETVELSSFLTYEYGMGIQEKLKQNYDEQLKAEKKQAERRKLEQIKSLKRRIKELGESPEEYMILLEQRNRDLEADSRQLPAVRAQVEELKGVVEQKNADIAALNENVRSLTETVAEKESEIERINAEHAAEIARMQEEFEAKFAEQQAEHERAVAELNDSWQARYDEAALQHAQEVSELKEAAAKEREELLTAAANEREEIKAAAAKKLEEVKTAAQKEKDELTGQLADSRQKFDDLEKAHKQTEENLLYTNVRLNALKQSSGKFDGTEDFNSRSGFDELEREYEYIKELFRKEWKKTKKSIRKKYLKVNVPEKPQTADKAEEAAETIETAEAAQSNLQEGEQSEVNTQPQGENLPEQPQAEAQPEEGARELLTEQQSLSGEQPENLHKDFGEETEEADDMAQKTITGITETDGNTGEDEQE